MLCELQIENIAVIEKATIPFQKGFNVMTGETGAGKSIIIDSIHAVLGERTSRELIRTGAEYAYVSALFFEDRPNIHTLLSENDLPVEEDGSILIQRRMSADGRNLCKINGATVTVSTVKTIAKELVNIHGQADNQSLLNAENHRHYLDSLAQNEALLAKYQEAFIAYKEAKKAYDSLNENEAEKRRKLDILAYQIDELESAKIQVGEFASVSETLTMLHNAAQITETLKSAYALLNGSLENEGAVSMAMQATTHLEGLEAYTSQYSALLSGIRESTYNLEAFTEELRDQMDTEAFDPAQADALEERLDVLTQLQKKYGNTEEDMLAYLENAKQEYENLTFSDERKAQLLQIKNQKRDIARNLATQLQKSRMAAAAKFQTEVAKVLKFLDMPSVTFKVEFKELAGLSSEGIDDVEFFLSANAGEESRPLNKIASGGELSRIMLAIKSVLAEKDKIDTLIFDEIDTGVSGRAAQKIAIQLAKLSASHQVICITHLAQIAAFGDAHLHIIKQENHGKTFTKVIPLDFEGRKQELARILGGLTVTDLQLKNAEELLSLANHAKTVDKSN